MLDNAQQMQDFDPMLLYCWAIVCNSGPTIQEHWVNVSRLLGMLVIYLCLSKFRNQQFYSVLLLNG